MNGYTYNKLFIVQRVFIYGKLRDTFNLNDHSIQHGKEFY